MLKKTLLALLFASSSIAAHAAPSGWNFSYTGVHAEFWNEWWPEAGIHGTFYGEDLNHDQVIDKSELTKLVVMGLEHVNCEENYSCYIHQFSFGLGNALDFATTYYYVVDGSMYGGAYVSSASGYTNYYDYPPYSFSFYFTPETKFSISPVAVSPVPEPATYAMMGAGLLGLALLQRRRKRSKSPV